MKILFRVISKTSDNLTEENYIKLQEESCSPDQLSPKSLEIAFGNVETGDLVEVSFFKAGFKNTRKLHFLHHFDRPNQGDVLSGPYHYFNFPEHDCISWDESIIKGKPIKKAESFDVIMGGGIYFLRNKPRLDKLMKGATNFIGWGLGLDTRVNLDEYIERFSLLGTREKKSHYIDNQKVFYVPCVSCMHGFFDGFLSNDLVEDSVKGVAVHLNHGFNKNEILTHFKSYDVTYTTSSYEKTFKNISEAEVVITNSYHGAYWGLLMGKKVICLATEVPKWDGLHANVVFSSLEDVENALKEVKSVPKEYLRECRSLNVSFYEKVRAHLNR